MPSFSAILETGKGCGNVLQVELAVLFGQENNNNKKNRTRVRNILLGWWCLRMWIIFVCSEGFLIVKLVLSDVANGRCRLQKNNPGQG